MTSPVQAKSREPIPEQEVELLQQLVDIAQQQLEEQRHTNSWLWTMSESMQGLGIVIAQMTEALAALGVDVSQIETTLEDFLDIWEVVNNVPGPPTGGSLSLSGGTMSLSVDTTPGSESVSFQFDDDHENPTSAPTGDGSGIVVTLSSADGGLTSVGSTTASVDDEGNPLYTAPITVITTVSGTAVFAVAYDNASSATLYEDDGVTVFPETDNYSVSITAGDPVEGSLSVAAS